MSRSYASQEDKARLPAWRRSGEFGSSWWANRWLDALDSIIDPERLARGRTYYRRGRVLSLKDTGGAVIADVQGSRRKPYRVRIELAQLSDQAWNRLFAALSSQAGYSAYLVAGEMPDDIGAACEQAGVDLFPGASGDLKTSCSCPDWANPCKHVAAVYYSLAKQFDDDPFLLFHLRGRTREQVIEALLGAASSSESESSSATVSEAPDVTDPGFWRCATPLADIAIAIRPPVVRLPAIKRLGEPPFAAKVRLADWLGPRLDAASAAALAAAYTEEAAPVSPESAQSAEAAKPEGHSSTKPPAKR